MPRRSGQTSSQPSLLEVALRKLPPDYLPDVLR